MVQVGKTVSFFQRKFRQAALNAPGNLATAALNAPPYRELLHPRIYGKKLEPYQMNAVTLPAAQNDAVQTVKRAGVAQLRLKEVNNPYLMEFQQDSEKAWQTLERLNPSANKVFQDPKKISDSSLLFALDENLLNIVGSMFGGYEPALLNVVPFIIRPTERRTWPKAELHTDLEGPVIRIFYYGDEITPEHFPFEYQPRSEHFMEKYSDITKRAPTYRERNYISDTYNYLLNSKRAITSNRQWEEANNIQQALVPKGNLLFARTDLFAHRAAIDGSQQRKTVMLIYTPRIPGNPWNSGRTMSTTQKLEFIERNKDNLCERQIESFLFEGNISRLARSIPRTSYGGN